MKIESQQPEIPIPAQLRGTDAGKPGASSNVAAEAETAPLGTSADHVRVSAPAADALRASDSKLERLKELYEQGSYSVPASEIARALIGEHEKL